MATDLSKTLDTIQSRRSVRKYDPDRTIDDETMHTILDCAMCSPTAVNAREWRFVVVRDLETRKKLSQSLPYCKFAAEPTAVCVALCAELDKEIAPGHWTADCGAAAHAMLIGAASLGVGSTWTSLHPFDDRKNNVAEILGIPKGVAPFSLIVFGYPPADKPLVKRDSRYNASLVHFDKW